MKKIMSVVLEPDKIQNVMIPTGATILGVAVELNPLMSHPNRDEFLTCPSLHFMCDPSMPPERREIIMMDANGGGSLDNVMPDGEHSYIGHVTLWPGEMTQSTFHIFERM